MACSLVRLVAIFDKFLKPNFKEVIPVKYSFIALSFLLPSVVLAGGKSYQEIETYTTDKASKPYVVMGQMNEKARTDEACVRQMAKKAAKKGGDAIIKIESKPTGAQGMWFGENVLHCQGVVVRWAREGEKGLTALNADTPVPFLFK